MVAKLDSKMVAKPQPFIILICLCSILGLGIGARVWAATIYSYVDDRGNLVYTDSAETIPEKYRAKVKTHEQPDSVSKSPSVMQSIQQKIKGQIKNFGAIMPSFHFDMDGLTPAQSKIVTYAGAAAVVLLLMMYLSKSQLTRMLGFCLLIVLGIGAPLLIYVSDSGPMDTMKKKAAASGQTQRDRLQQVPR
ncbi:MAG: hypothetical protein A4E19_19005 [Nitrospira sp. SG-bin1]|nr:MAG: hypothetical protein A4E19_19005 [Nitrospira sp. SG-bin1]